MIRPLFFATSLFLFFICSTAAADAQTVSGSIANGSVARGGSGRGSVVLTIPDGLHVNSNRPASEYAIATVVTVKGPSGVRVGGVTYPRGRNRKFQFSENLINVYEGRVNFPFTLRVPSNFRGSTLRITAAVRYQACTDEVCYPPRTKNVTLTAKVR
jgi:DsbC/DsbD-like thiol-disulfide interchange protein